MTTLFRAKLAFSSFILLLSFIVSAQTEKLQEEKELEVVDLRSIKKVLQQDGLSEAAAQKKKQVAVMKKEQVVVEQERFLYPSEEELWGLASEFWLVKNAQILGWDFVKPDYGIDQAFKSVLEGLGFYQKKFKILLINTPSIVRASLPGPNGEMILLLSVPFIRSMDLSKLEISLLLLEDYFRLQAGYFKKGVETEKMKTLAGTSFLGKKVDMGLIEELLKKYDYQINQKGFTFQQQFETTKKMDSFLKSKPELWNVYFQLLSKLQSFLKINVQYKEYLRLYPSPEMQLKWISPEEKLL